MAERIALAERLKALNDKFSTVTTNFSLDTPVTAKKAPRCDENENQENANAGNNGTGTGTPLARNQQTSFAAATPVTVYRDRETGFRRSESMTEEPEEFSTPKGSPQLRSSSERADGSEGGGIGAAPAVPADVDLTPLSIKEGVPTPDNLNKQKAGSHPPSAPPEPVAFNFPSLPPAAEAPAPSAFILREAAPPLSPSALQAPSVSPRPAAPGDMTMLEEMLELPSYLDATLEMHSPAPSAQGHVPSDPRPTQEAPAPLSVQIPSNDRHVTPAPSDDMNMVSARTGPPSSAAPPSSVPSPMFDDAFQTESLALVSRLRGEGQGQQGNPAVTAAHEAELQYLRGEVANVRRERDELIRLCHEHEATIQQLRDRESRLEVESEAKARLLEGQMRKGEDRYAQLLHSFEDLTARYVEVKKRYEAALQNEARVKEALDDFEARAGSAYQDLSGEFQQTQGRLVEALAENATLRQQMESRASEVQSIMRAQEDMRQAVAERASQAEQYRLMNESLRAQLDTTTQQLSQANLARQQQAMELESAKVQLQEAHRAVRQYQENLERGAKENADLVEMCKTLMGRLEQAQKNGYLG